MKDARAKCDSLARLLLTEKNTLDAMAFVSVATNKAGPIVPVSVLGRAQPHLRSATSFATPKRMVRKWSELFLNIVRGVM